MAILASVRVSPLRLLGILICVAAGSTWAPGQQSTTLSLVVRGAVSLRQGGSAAAKQPTPAAPPGGGETSPSEEQNPRLAALLKLGFDRRSEAILSAWSRTVLPDEPLDESPERQAVGAQPSIDDRRLGSVARDDGRGREKGGADAQPCRKRSDNLRRGSRWENGALSAITYGSCPPPMLRTSTIICSVGSSSRPRALLLTNRRQSAPGA